LIWIEGLVFLLAVDIVLRQWNEFQSYLRQKRQEKARFLQLLADKTRRGDDYALAQRLVEAKCNGQATLEQREAPDTVHKEQPFGEAKKIEEVKNAE
jgi:hypothetical protein